VFAGQVAVLDAVRAGRLEPAEALRIGPPLVFERFWAEAGLPDILRRLLADRRYEFPVERAVFLTVLHRLFDPGSDRATEVWREGYALDGMDDLGLHHLYWVILQSCAPLVGRKIGGRCSRVEADLGGHRRHFSGFGFQTTWPVLASTRS